MQSCLYSFFQKKKKKKNFQKVYGTDSNGYGIGVPGMMVMHVICVVVLIVTIDKRFNKFDSANLSQERIYNDGQKDTDPLLG